MAKGSEPQSIEVYRFAVGDQGRIDYVETVERSVYTRRSWHRPFMAGPARPITIRLVSYHGQLYPVRQEGKTLRIQLTGRDRLQSVVAS